MKTTKFTVRSSIIIPQLVEILAVLMNMLTMTVPIIVNGHTKMVEKLNVTKAIMTMALHVKLVNTVKSLKLNGYVLNVTLFKLLVLLVSKVSLTAVNATQQHIWKNMILNTSVMLLTMLVMLRLRTV